MRALRFSNSLPELIFAGIMSRIATNLAIHPISPLDLVVVEDPKIPGPGWMKLRPLLTGICGSDLKQAFLQADVDNPLSGLLSFPHIMGHEIVAKVVETASRSTLKEGDIVAVEPWLGCRVRGLDLCSNCASGKRQLCLRTNEPVLPGIGTGMHIGNIRGLPGGFSEFMLAHETQCYKLPDTADPRSFIFSDPLAVAVHAVTMLGSVSDDVLVLGAGTIGICTTFVLSKLYPNATVYVTCAWPHLEQVVKSLGAVPLPIDTDKIIDILAEFKNIKVVQPWRGGRWLLHGGFSSIIDTIGSSSTADTALRLASTRGRIVVVGVGKSERYQRTLNYYKEISMIGSNGYGDDPQTGEPEFKKAIDMILESPEVVANWCTHTFSLNLWKQAFLTAINPNRTGAIKVAIYPED